MTSTSFHSSQPSCHELFRDSHDGDSTLSKGDIATQESLALQTAHAVEARRMRTFAGQHKFQAPVEEDFCRGLLKSNHGSSDNAKPLKHSRLMNYLTAWWSR